jgi:Tfp pilus assembly protein PilZ
MSKSNAATSVISFITSRRTRAVAHAEKRAGTRIRSSEVSVHLVDDDGSLIPFDSFDLSAGGINLRSDLLYYPGDEIILQIGIPGQPAPLVIVGEVVRVDMDNDASPGMGVSFWSLTSRERRILSDFLYQK